MVLLFVFPFSWFSTPISICQSWWSVPKRMNQKRYITSLGPYSRLALNSSATIKARSDRANRRARRYQSLDYSLIEARNERARRRVIRRETADYLVQQSFRNAFLRAKINETLKLVSVLRKLGEACPFCSQDEFMFHLKLIRTKRE